MQTAEVQGFGSMAEHYYDHMMDIRAELNEAQYEEKLRPACALLKTVEDMENALGELTHSQLDHPELSLPELRTAEEAELNALLETTTKQLAAWRKRLVEMASLAIAIVDDPMR